MVSTMTEVPIRAFLFAFKGVDSGSTANGKMIKLRVTTIDIISTPYVLRHIKI